MSLKPQPRRTPRVAVNLNEQDDRDRLNALEARAKVEAPLDLTGNEALAMAGIFEAMRLVRKTAFPRWYRNPKTGEAVERNFGEVIALMHSELSEALEGHRRNLMDDHLPDRPMIEVELADTVIRILDTCAELGLDLAGAIIEKNRYNDLRADHSDAARAEGEGKAY